MTDNEVFESLEAMNYVTNNDYNSYHNIDINYFLADVHIDMKQVIFTYQLVDESENNCVRRFEHVIKYENLSLDSFVECAMKLFKHYSDYYDKLNVMLWECEKFGRDIYWEA